MKRILILIDSLTCGGAEKSLISLLPFLAERDYKITLYVRAKGGLFERYGPDPVTLKIFPFRNSRLRDIAYSVALRMPWNKKVHTAELYWKTIGCHLPELPGEYDVAIAYQQGFPTFYIAEKVKAKKKICWVNADLKSVGYSPSFCRRFYGAYHRISAVSDVLRDTIIYPEYEADKTKIFTCWDILNEKLIRSMALEGLVKKDGTSTIHITTVGRLVPLKGYDLAINAARILKDEGFDFIWHIVGGGGIFDRLKNMADDLGLKDNLIFEGEQLNPYPFIAAADVYVQTSRFEGFGITVGEAKILGKPIVSTNFPVVYNQITDGENGLIVEMTPRAIADGVIRILRDTQLRLNLENAVRSEHNTTAETESAKVIKLIEADL